MPPAAHSNVLPSSSFQPPTSSRGRPQAGRRRANPITDDSAYHGTTAIHPVSAGTKRIAADKPDGEPRVKRKRIEPAGSFASVGAGGSNGNAARKAQEKGVDGEVKHPLIDFTALPTDALHRYLIQFDIVPEVDPPPTTALDPPQSLSLLRGLRHGSTASPAPQLAPITPANRPRREASASANRRRSSRLLEDDRRPSVMPVLADINEIHRVLAQLAGKHFSEQSVKEMDTLAAFSCAVRAKARMRG